MNLLLSPLGGLYITPIANGLSVLLMEINNGYKCEVHIDSTRLSLYEEKYLSDKFGKSTTFAFASVDDISTNRHHYMSLCVFSFIYL